MKTRKPRKPLFFTQDCTRVCQGHQRKLCELCWCSLAPAHCSPLPCESLGAPWPTSGALLLQICRLWAHGSVLKAPKFARMGDLERILLLAISSVSSASVNTLRLCSADAVSEEYWERFLVIITSWSPEKCGCGCSSIIAIPCHLRELMHILSLKEISSYCRSLPNLH